MYISTNLFAGGKTKALTLSYDDGVTQDRRLVEILDRHGIKCTFNLNSATMRDRRVWTNKGIEIARIGLEEVAGLFKNHEVAVHTYTHPHLELLPKERIASEIYEDKKKLEELVEYPVRGMAYPFGTYSKAALEVMENLGIEYSRTVQSHEKFKLPDNFLEWNPTCHHKNNRLMELARNFLEREDKSDCSLFYVWGHSYEFDVDDNWPVIEEFCKYVSGHDTVWYATNIQVVDYLKAVKALKFSTTGNMAYNPSALSVWVKVEGETIEIKPGETKKFC